MNDHMKELRLLVDCPGVPCDKPSCAYYEEQPDDATWTCSRPSYHDLAVMALEIEKEKQELKMELHDSVMLGLSLVDAAEEAKYIYEHVQDMIEKQNIARGNTDKDTQ